MAARAGLIDTPEVPLSLVAGQRIVTQDGKPVLGWIGPHSARVAEPLVFPSRLLEPKPAEAVCYAANLPRSAGKAMAMPAANVQAPGDIRGRRETAFFAATLPGGQIGAAVTGGGTGLLRFRWLPLDPGTWRCFVDLRGTGRDNAWTPLPHLYAFDSSGFPVSHPGPQVLNFGHGKLEIIHPENWLTCLPCSSGLVKVRGLAADGWARRELLGIRLLPDMTIEAEFSDRRRQVFATAAPHATSALAA
jgi:hypothetical protein